MHYSTLTLCISLLAMASPILSAPASPMVSGCEGYAPCRRISHLFRNERKIFFVSGSSKPSIKNHLPNSLSMPPPPQGLHPPNSASNSQRHSSPDASPGTIKKSPPSSSFADGVMPAELSLGKIRCPYGPPDQGQRQTFSYRYTYTTTLRETHVDSVILGIVMLLAVAVILIGLMDVICLVANKRAERRSALLRNSDTETLPKYIDVNEKAAVEVEPERSYSASPESW